MPNIHDLELMRLVMLEHYERERHEGTLAPYINTFEDYLILMLQKAFILTKDLI